MLLKNEAAGDNWINFLYVAGEIERDSYSVKYECKNNSRESIHTR